MFSLAVKDSSLSKPPLGRDKGWALVPINVGTVEFTSGVIGGAIGLAIGGPVAGVAAAAAANYISRTDDEPGEVVQGLSRNVLEELNQVAAMGEKYEIQAKASQTVESLKSRGGVSAEVVKKIEDVLDRTSIQTQEIMEKHDVVDKASVALGVMGDLVEKGVRNVDDLNKKYKPVEKAADAIKGGVDDGLKLEGREKPRY